MRSLLLLLSLSAIALACSSRGGGLGAVVDGGTPSSDTTCPEPPTCARATSLGRLSGDGDGGGALTASGRGPAWYTVLATEDVSAWSGRPMRLRASLVAPEGYSLRAYAYTPDHARDGGALSDAGRGLDCDDEVARSTRSSQGAELSLAWGELVDGGSANGLDDSRVVAIEIRSDAAGCIDGAWTLRIEGD